MARTVRLGVLMLGLAATFVACRTVPIVSIQDERLSTDGSTALPDAAEAIWRAGRKAGWDIEPISPGELQGTYRLKAHLAVVRITYDTSHFSIRYEGSENLLRSGNLIHHNYNTWVRSLADQIEREPVRCCASFMQENRSP